MATYTTQKAPFQKESTYITENNYILLNGIQFSDGTTMSTAASSRQVKIIDGSWAAGNTSAMGASGVGNYAPSDIIFIGPYVSGPRNIVIEIDMDFGGQPTGTAATAITAGETCVLRVLTELKFIGGTTEDLPSQYVTVNAPLCNLPPGGLGLQTHFWTYVYSLSAGQQINGAAMSVELVGPAAGSANTIAIGETNFRVYSAE